MGKYSERLNRKFCEGETVETKNFFNKDPDAINSKLISSKKSKKLTREARSNLLDINRSIKEGIDKSISRVNEVITYCTSNKVQAFYENIERIKIFDMMHAAEVIRIKDSVAKIESAHKNLKIESEQDFMSLNNFITQYAGVASAYQQLVIPIVQDLLMTSGIANEAVSTFVEGKA